MRNTIKHRTSQWWQPKAGLILAIVYLAFWLYKIPSSQAFLYFLPAICTIFGIGIFGHILNDWADLDADRKVGKDNMLEGWSCLRKYLFLLSSLLLALLPWLFLPQNEFSILLLVAEFFFLIIYALPPFRIKTKGVFAIANDALYAYAVPALLAFHTFMLLTGGAPDLFLYAAILLWQFSTGIFNMMLHQIEDRENDIATQTTTWTTQNPPRKIRRAALLLAWPIMIVFFCGFVVLVAVEKSWVYIFLLMGVLLHLIMIFSKKTFGEYLKSPLTADLQRINLHYHLFLPYWCLLLLLCRDIMYLPLLVVHFTVFNYNAARIIFKKLTYPFLSFIVNHGIYYFRRFVMFQSVKVAMRGYYAEYKKDKDDRQLQKKLPNILMANSNADKYTETFVKRHIEYLKDSNYYVHQLYGGYLPNAEIKRGLLISNKQELLKWKEFLSFFLGRNKEYDLKKSLKNYLLDNNIRLVLAEFGQTGSELVEICREIKVPLIVVFYGYDAHHKKVVGMYEDKYQVLFQEAVQIICVSKDILNVLKNMGAAEEKLVYLPCAFDVERFQYTDHSQNSPIFLSVGRFAETKSPHLTILAFNEVLKKNPDARLRMIGKDGGGELFEACHILVQALNIQNKVDFLGVLSPMQVYEEMKKARVFVQHSVTTPLHGDKEGTPVSVMEAMASGLPVVATYHAGIAELIQSGENGILVKEYDYLSMAKEMVCVCNSDTLVHELGKNAAEGIRNNGLIVRNKEIFVDLVEKYRLK